MTVMLWIVNGAIVIGLVVWWRARRGSHTGELRVPMNSKRVAELYDRDVH